MIIDLEVVLRELMGSVDPTKAQNLRIHEPAEAIVIGKNENFVLAAI